MSLPLSPEYFLTAFVRTVLMYGPFASAWGSWGDPMFEIWPSGPAKNIAEHYWELGFKEERSHDYALWSCEQSMPAEFAQVVETMFEVPEDHNELRGMYSETIRVLHARKLAVEINRDPSKTDALIDRYQSRAKLDGEPVKLGGDVLDQIFQDYDAAVDRGESIIKINRFERLSELIGGFNPSRLGLCQAETGTGKTTLALNLALAASETMSVLYVNMEMGLRDMAERIATIKLGRDFMDIRKDGIRTDGQKVSLDLKRREFHMTAGEDLSVTQIKNYARRLKTKLGKLDLVVVDYDQKLTLEISRHVPEWSAIQKAMISLEGLAKELGTYVLALAQTNRDGDISGSFRSTFPASSVWHFLFDDELGDHVIRMKKNRFGDYSRQIRFEFEKTIARITEKESMPFIKKQKKGHDL